MFEKIFLLLVICAWLVPKHTALAQEYDTKKWNYLGDLYMMFPNMKDDIGYKFIHHDHEVSF